MKSYRLFFSWQSDRPETKRTIRKALEIAKSKLSGNGIELIVDEDTRDRVGTANIESEVLKKINECDIFLADLSPVTTYAENKLAPNPNVMFEYGYAKAKLGANRCILVASLKDGQKMGDLPFDINHDTITPFNDASGLEHLHRWITNIADQVEKDRELIKSQNSCKVLFGNYSTQTTVFPQFKRYYKDETDLHDEKPTVKYTDDKWEDYQVKQFKSNGSYVATLGGSAENLSIVPVDLLFINDGTSPLENCEVTLTFEDDKWHRFEESNIKSSAMPYGVHFRNDPQEISEKQVFQKLEVVNPDSEKEIDTFYLHALPQEENVIIRWKMTSKHFSKEGTITVSVNPQFKDIEKSDCPDKTLIVKDYIIDK